VKYDTLYEEFLSLFPDDVDRLSEKASEVSAEPSDGMHVMFGMVVVPFVMELLECKDERKLKIAFDFFEEMAKAENSMISEVLEFTILEDIISRGRATLDKCKQYMKQNTLDSCSVIEKYMLQ
jgi:hypothetical protein